MYAQKDRYHTHHAHHTRRVGGVARPPHPAGVPRARSRSIRAGLLALDAAARGVVQRFALEGTPSSLGSLLRSKPLQHVESPLRRGPVRCIRLRRHLMPYGIEARRGNRRLCRLAAGPEVAPRERSGMHGTSIRAPRVDRDGGMLACMPTGLHHIGLTSRRCFVSLGLTDRCVFAGRATDHRAIDALP